MMLRTWKDRKIRGQVLLMTAFFIFVLFTLALTFFKLVPMELNSALRTKQMVSAQVIADSGIREARVWLQRQDPARVLNDTILEDEFNRTVRENPIALGNTWDEDASEDDVIGPWTYAVTLKKNPTNPFAFDAVSTCYFDEKPMRQVRATLARENFSQYALFIDQWGDDLIMQASPGAIQGPFHTNDFFRLVIPSGFYSGGSESFVSGVDGVMTHAGATTEGSLAYVNETGDGNAYHSSSGSGNANSDANAVPYDEDGEVSGRYESLVRGGRSNLSSTEHITLPYNANELLVQSLGAEDAAGAVIPSEVGIYVETDGPTGPVKGGIYLVGSASIDLSLDSSGNQVHTFVQTIPEDAYAYQTEEPYQEPIYDNVPRTLGLNDSYNVSTPVLQDVTRQVQVGTEIRTETITEQVPTGRRLVTGGSGTTVGTYQTTYRTVTRTVEREVAVFDTVTEQQTVMQTQSVTITDPNDPRIGDVVNSFELVGYEDRTRTVNHIVSEEDYEANPNAYPGAYPVELPGTPQTAQVTEIDGPNPQTRVVDYDGNEVVYDGALNGVTFVDGNITSLKGVSKGARDMNFPDEQVYQGRYIVANPAFSSAGKMTITDDLLQYYDGPDSALVGAVPKTLKVGELSPGSQHSLGLVAKDTRLKPTVGDALNMYAVIISGRSLPCTGSDTSPPDVEGGFGSDESIMANGNGFTDFNLFGGLVQANQMLWHRDGNGLSGNFTFDPAVAGNLPRFPRSNRVATLRYADRYIPNEDALYD